MRAALITEHGAPRLGDIEAPQAANGAVPADVVVAGLNPVDLAIASGKMPALLPEQLPAVAGREGIAELDGRRVYFDAPLKPYGSMGERTLIEPDATIELPDGIGPDDAVAFGIAGLAGWLSLEWRAKLRDGETVVVLGAGGVVGQVAVQAARILGAARVVAVTRDAGETPEPFERLGADRIVEVGDDLGAQLRDACGEHGADVIVDPVWGEPAAQALEALAVDGRLVQIGNSAGPEAPIAARNFRNQLGAILGHTNFKVPHEVKRQAFQSMCRYAIEGELRIETERVPLEDVERAWERQGHSPHHKLVIAP